MSNLTKPDFDYDDNVDDSEIENPAMEQIDSDDEPWPEDEQSPGNELLPDDEQWLDDELLLDNKQLFDDEILHDELLYEEEPAKAAPNETKTPVRNWFYTFMCMNIPIIGWFYLMYLAFSKKKTERRNFARAYLFYKLIFLIIAAVILGVAIYIGLNILDQVLAYMEML